MAVEKDLNLGLPLHYPTRILSEKVIHNLLYGLTQTSDLSLAHAQKDNVQIHTRGIRFGGFTRFAKLTEESLLKTSGFQSVVSRSIGRVDFQLSNKFVQATGIAHDLTASSIISQAKQMILNHRTVEATTTNTKTKVKSKIKKLGEPVIRTINVMMVRPQATNQPVHVDMPGTMRGLLYVTILIPLNPTTVEMGGTEFFYKASKLNTSEPPEAPETIRQETKIVANGGDPPPKNLPTLSEQEKKKECDLLRQQKPLKEEKKEKREEELVMHKIEQLDLRDNITRQSNTKKTQPKEKMEQKSLVVYDVKCGYGFMFRGNVAHRGLANRSTTTRYFLYIAVSCFQDANTDPACYAVC